MRVEQRLPMTVTLSPQMARTAELPPDLIDDAPPPADRSGPVRDQLTSSVVEDDELGELVPPPPPTLAAAPPATEAPGYAPDTRALEKELAHLSQALQEDEAKCTELQTAIDALATLKGVGDNIWLDQRMTSAELSVVAGRGDERERAAARFLLAHPEYLRGGRNGEGNGDLIQWRMDELITTLQAQRRTAEGTLRADRSRLNEVEVDLGRTPTRFGASAPASPQAPAQSPATASGASTTGGSSVASGPLVGTDALLAAPVRLEMGAVEGSDPLTSATSRLSNALGGLQGQIDQVVAQLGQEPDEGKRRALENRLNQLNRAMTEIANLLQQLMTMMQNIAKLYNDIAMNSIRHIA
jgi:hypothetical protein